MKQQILKQLKEYPLGNDDLKSLYPYAKIFSYPELEHMKSIDQAFYFHPNGIGTSVMLFLTDADNIGHWIGLIKRGNEIEMYDPYGNKPEELNKNVGGRMNYKQDPKLLRDKVRESGYKLISNSDQVQPESPDINTCGRHVIMRLLFADKPLKEYHQKVKQLARQNGISIDTLVTKITADKLGK